MENCPSAAAILQAFGTKWPPDTTLRWPDLIDEIRGIESQLGLLQSSIITKSPKSSSDKTKQRQFQVGEELNYKLSKYAHGQLTLFYLFHTISNNFYVLMCFFKNLSRRELLLVLESGVHASARVTGHSLDFSCPLLGVSLHVLWAYPLTSGLRSVLSEPPRLCEFIGWKVGSWQGSIVP